MQPSSAQLINVHTAPLCTAAIIRPQRISANWQINHFDPVNPCSWWRRRGSGTHPLPASTENFGCGRMEVCWTLVSLGVAWLWEEGGAVGTEFYLCFGDVLNFFDSPSSGLHHVHLHQGLWGAALLHPEEAVPAERPPLRGSPLPRHRRLALLPGQQDRTCGVEEASGESPCEVFCKPNVMDVFRFRPRNMQHRERMSAQSRSYSKPSDNRFISDMKSEVI